MTRLRKNWGLLLKRYWLNLISILSVFYITLASGESAAEEKTVSIPFQGGELVADFTKPQNRASKGTFLFLHGLSGERRGPQIKDTADHWFERAAQSFADAGYASLTFSTGGRGGSSGSFLDMSFERRADETKAVLAWLKEQEENCVFLIGYSQGSIVAAEVAASQSSQLCGLTLLSPNAHPKRNYIAAMGHQTYKRGLEAVGDEVVSWQRGNRKMRAFRGPFFQDIATLDPIADVECFAKPMLILFGQRDRSSMTGEAKSLAVAHGGVSNIASFDVGHRLGADLGQARVDEGIGAIIHWSEDVRQE